MLKKVYILLLIIISSVSILSQTDLPEHAIYPPVFQYSANTRQNIVDEMVFVNINLSGNTAPQNEPSIRISRQNPNYIVAAWRDFRLGYTNPVIRRIGYTYSTNGGLTFAPSQLLPDPAPTYVSQSDPVVVNDAQGNFYISSTSRRTNTPPELRDQIVYKSTNNGQTFAFVGVGMPNTGGSGEDKEWFFCDPVPSNQTYNNLMITSTNLNNGIIRFTKSTNGGSVWSTPVNVSDGASGSGSNLAVGINGNIYVVWGGIRFDKSTNGGTSFGTDFVLRSAAGMQGFPFICVDYSNRPSRGNIYVCWDENTDVYIQRSTNAGVSWLGAPIRVNTITTNNQIWPAIQCDTNGYLSVVYYDNSTSPGYHSNFAYSTDAGNTWVNQVLSDSSFTMTAVGSEVRYGDYIGIDAFSNKIFPVWTDDRRGTPNQEIYTASLSIVSAAGINQNEIPSEFALKQNYPNPFNPETIINFDISRSSFVTLKVYDVLGKELNVIVNENLPAGRYSKSFDASKLSSGIYFYTLKARQNGSLTGDYSETRKMILLK